MVSRIKRNCVVATPLLLCMYNVRVNSIVNMAHVASTIPHVRVWYGHCLRLRCRLPRNELRMAKHNYYVAVNIMLYTRTYGQMDQYISRKYSRRQATSNLVKCMHDHFAEAHTNTNTQTDKPLPPISNGRSGAPMLPSIVVAIQNAYLLFTTVLCCVVSIIPINAMLCIYNP